jgi:hypothetical protein
MRLAVRLAHTGAGAELESALAVPVRQVLVAQDLLQQQTLVVAAAAAWEPVLVAAAVLVIYE